MQKFTREEEFNKVLNQIPKHVSGLLYISQRFGKTRLMLTYINKAGYDNILWVAKEKSFRTNGLAEDCAKFGFMHLLPRIKVQTYSSLHKEVGKYDLIVLDEIQSITPNNSINLRTKLLNANYILGMSGTKTRDKEKQHIIHNILKLKVILEYSIVRASEKGIIADYDIEVHRIPLSKKNDFRIKTKKSNFITSEKKHYEYLSRSLEKAVGEIQKKSRAIFRTRFLSEVDSKISKIPELIEGRTLIFVESVKTAEKLLYFFHGQSTRKHLTAFENKEIPYLALIRKASVGYNFYDIDTVIIAKPDNNKNGVTIQKIMRGFINDKKVKIKILCSKGTQDERATDAVIKDFDKNKVRFITYEI